MSQSAHKSIALLFLIIMIGVVLSPIAFVPRYAFAQGADSVSAAKKAAAGAPALAAACATTAVATEAPGVATAAESVLLANSTAVLVALPPTISKFIGSLAGADVQNNFKQNCLNAIAWYLAKIIIDQIVQSTIQWINGGFKGGPTFVTNPGQFFANVADESFVGFMNDLFPQTEGLTKFLCSPFSFEIEFKLALQFNFSNRTREQVKCRVSDIIRNVGDAGKSLDQSMSDFYSGDFSEGGWNRWFEITQNPSNNKYGAELIATQALNARISSAVGREQMVLDWGQGFHSITKPLQDGFNEIITPGQTIENALAEVTTEDIRQLGLVDEFNEIVGALLSQMMKTVFSAGGGVSGLSQRSNGGFSYLDRLTASSSGNNTYDQREIGNNTTGFVGTSTTVSVDTQQKGNIAPGKVVSQSWTYAYDGSNFDRTYGPGIANDGQDHIGSQDIDVESFNYKTAVAAVAIPVPETVGVGAWWEIDLGEPVEVERVQILPVQRPLTGKDSKYATNHFTVLLSDSIIPENQPVSAILQNSNAIKWFTRYDTTSLLQIITFSVSPTGKARFLRIQRHDLENEEGRLELLEVKVFLKATTE